jgi:hypothetical protein
LNTRQVGIKKFDIMPLILIFRARYTLARSDL